ncbi:MAG: Gfo/Idh/MocA family oxidoreductase [Planctomycetes bacterium]|nr:Gfo/Idh/MocA family oxidoreductase [Planctomycetota bacterium]
MHCLVVGYGSIGARHAEILAGLGHEVAVITARTDAPWPRYRDVAAALAARDFGYLVIAGPTEQHHAALVAAAAAGFSGAVLVEKPLFSAPAALPADNFSSLHVGYNFRFDPLIQRLRRRIAERPVHTFSVYCGQHLASWRKGRDYRQCYSAHRAGGGGALRDLSHELDYASWLLGGWSRTTALGGRCGDLEIDSDDAFALLLVTPRCPLVQIQVNYLDRISQRVVIANLEGLTVRADLVTGQFQENDQVIDLARERNASFIAQHQAVLTGAGGESLCTLEQGLEVLKLIAGAEQAARERVWVERC